ncbi:MAG: HlyC/CorC family transporter [Saprospiraceae bacterium]|nr:HlyC/CorC family transporter [Saprospiraceae bacterium]MBK7810241.1 HlyC/CorC family transporter [Saprospiraceae bacterium]MBK9629844.1 HlyC/CorC family transporter [Saprospiraceae bacterium]
MLFFWIIFFLIISAFFSGSEIAFFTANKLSIEVKKNKGHRSSNILSEFYDKPEKFISVILIGNNIALVCLTYLLTTLFSPFFEYVQWSIGMKVLVNTLLVTTIILIFGEFLPKILFRLFANELISYTALPLTFLSKILYIPSLVMTSASNFLIRKFSPTTITPSRYRFSILDLEHYMEGPMKLTNEEIDTDIFKNTLNLKQVRVKNCMVPRNEIVHMDISEPASELIKLIGESKLSRILITDGDIDNVLGYVHHQQMFKPSATIKEMVMDMPFVPETLNVYDLMLRMNKLRLSIACVVDEYGGTSGIITLEDILEQIFGEIEDEHDKEDFIEKIISEKEFVFSGRLEINYLNNTYDLHLPEGEYHTLSGYLVMTTGAIPEEGMEIQQDGYTFIFELVSDTKIETVRLIKD